MGSKTKIPVTPPVKTSLVGRGPELSDVSAGPENEDSISGM
jgi:hypothetical protein